jgi:peptidoglycan/LPS O-acetylase OafA/YrhL
MKYIKQLDGVRAIAVILVIVSHWIPKLNILPWGSVGVDIFFVLSGFLISGILLENKKLHDDTGVSNGKIIKNFIIRRTLRIFPVYYLMVLIHFMVADFTGTTVKENILFYLTYTSNILFFKTGELDGIASHFWSLAVEEQFYLFWPWIILLVKERHLIKMIVIFGCVGIMFPLVLGDDSGILTPACFSAFAIGALLSYLNSRGFELTNNQVRIVNYLTIASIVLLSLYPFLKTTVFSVFSVRLPVSVITFWTIRYCLYGNDLIPLNWILSNRVLIFIGKISYSVYVYHTIIPWLWRIGVNSLERGGFNIHSLYFLIPKYLYNDIDLLIKFLLLILISWLSWTLIESPINRLKRRFEYKESKSILTR